MLLRLAMLCLPALPLAAAEPLRSIRELLALSPEQASESRPLIVEVTLLVDDRFRSTFFIHDGTASCYARIPGRLHGDRLKRGQRYRFQGISEPGGYRPIIAVTAFSPLGPGQEPEPQKVRGDSIFTTALDAQWVELEGRVESSSIKEGGPCLDLSLDGWKIEAFLPRDVSPSASPPWHLIGQRIRVRGVVASVFNDERQMTRRFIYIPSLDQVKSEGTTPNAPAKRMQINTLLRLGSELGQLVRVRGIVTHSIEGDAVYLRDSSGTLRILSAQPTAFTPGDEIEAEGFPELDSMRPALNATELRKISQGPAPEPVRLDPNDKLTTHLHHELVRGTASLLALGESQDALILQCQSGQRVYEALLDRRLAQALPPGLTPGCQLQLTGLMELRPSRLFYMPDWIDGFRLHLRGKDDILILSSPPWWNARRLSWLLLGVLTLSAAAGTWAFILRRTVQAQTLLIKEKVERAAVLEERQRIAREMHDTFQQSLAGAGHLVDDALRRLNGSNHEAKTPLQLARQMLRHCREESRASIAELRSLTLESLGITEAFDSLLRPVVENAGLHFALTVSAALPDIPKSHSHALLRIAQESVNNTIKHGRARSIRVSLSAPGSTLTLSVADDGCGFDPAATQAMQGHFGILGMKERAQKLGGTVEITSTPRGTEVTATLPLDAAAFDEPLIISKA